MQSSKHRLDLVPLRLSKDWTVNPIEAIRLSGVHGGEIVRSVHVSNAVSIYDGLYTSILIDRLGIGRYDIHGGRGRARKSMADVCRWWGWRAGARGSREAEEEEEKKGYC